jgi:pimeloyl-ACP methyl ester carboxylesterase
MGGRTARTASKETILLVHGLWMKGKELRFLGRRLTRSGFDVLYFRYPSWRGDLGKIAAGLREFVEQSGRERVHLLGHSMGGVIIARMLAEGPSRRLGRIALLGSPLRGSAVARSLARCRPGRFLLGPVAMEGIVQTFQDVSGSNDLLVIGGTFPLGSGLLFGLPRPHDGLIRTSETRVDGARCEFVRTSHMGLLFSREVMDMLCTHFSDL